MAAGIAAHGIVFEFFVQFRRSLGRPHGQDLAKRRLSFRSYGHGEENAGNQARIAGKRRDAKNTTARFAMLSRSKSYVEFVSLMTESPTSLARRI
jgi:hypothetical protein